jgi:hypothetical protein
MQDEYKFFTEHNDILKRALQKDQAVLEQINIDNNHNLRNRSVAKRNIKVEEPTAEEIQE